MRMYISIPIEGLEELKQREKADLMQGMLSRLGHETVNPFDIYAGEDPTYIDHIVADLKELYRCDAIVMCSGWQKSKGCRLEYSFAQIYGLRVILQDVEFPKSREG